MERQRFAEGWGNKEIEIGKRKTSEVEGKTERDGPVSMAGGSLWAE